MSNTKAEYARMAYEQDIRARVVAKKVAEYYASMFQKELSLIRFNAMALAAIVILSLLSLVFSESHRNYSIVSY